MSVVAVVVVITCDDVRSSGFRPLPRNLIHHTFKSLFGYRWHQFLYHFADEGLADARAGPLRDLERVPQFLYRLVRRFMRRRLCRSTVVMFPWILKTIEHLYSINNIIFVCYSVRYQNNDVVRDDKICHYM